MSRTHTFRFIFTVVAVCAVFAVVPAFAFAQSGIIAESVWVSPSQPEEGEDVRVYTAIFNDRPETLSGVAVFRDGEEVMGQREFSVAEGDLVGISVPWTAEAGKHLFSVSLQDTKLIARDGTSQSIILERGGAQTTFALTPSFDEVATKGKETAAGLAGQVSEKGQTAASIVAGAVPESVKEQAAAALGKAEEFREEGEMILRQKKEESAAAPQSENTGEEEEEEFPIVRNIAGALWSVPLAIFEHAALFYLALIALAFFISRWVLRKFRRRGVLDDDDDDDDEEE